jgi:hypothetical protein
MPRRIMVVMAIMVVHTISLGIPRTTGITRIAIVTLRITAITMLMDAQATHTLKHYNTS